MCSLCRKDEINEEVTVSKVTRIYKYSSNFYSLSVQYMFLLA